MIDVNGQFLVAATSKNVIKMWNVSRNSPKVLGAMRKFEDGREQALGDIRSVRVNCDGTRCSLLVDQKLNPTQAGSVGGALRVPDSRLFVYDTDSDSFLTYKVGKNRVPVAHSWESGDPRLMSCEAVPQALAYSGDEEEDPKVPPSPSGGAAGADEDETQTPGHTLLTLFVAGSDKILLQDSISCWDAEKSVPQMPVAVVVPHIYFMRTAEVRDVGSEGGPSGAISRSVLRDFVGLEHVDQSTTAALLDFSYHLACGNTDEAYKSVKGVQSKGVWESMSKMCVKTGRLDVAQKCLGQMGHARAAGALRACEEPEPEARLAVVAVHLGMIEDAEALLRKCHRYDLLNQLFQACGEWEKALEIAKTKDRVHLKPTHFAYAQHLEALEDVQGALSHFELSGTYRTESPRLLCSLGLVEDLEAYVEHSDDNALHRWYAQYLESKSNLEEAAREYKKAGDWLSLCRVACFNKDLERAQQICEESGDSAACYHFARHLEAEGRIKEAIHYFSMAGRVQHALRLAQENNMESDLMSLALSSDPAHMAQAARYYEQRDQPSKAVILYQKAGCQKRALELCFQAKLFESLRQIADGLSADSDPEMLARCAEFFMQHRQHDKAVHLLSISHQYETAVELCVEHDVQITEDMAERMTPDKGSMDQEKRSELLHRMAQLCKKQGSFQLACKKFTQAGNKLKAMKALLSSGDTEKIIFFAGTAKQAEIYVLAGNYLQSLDWHNNPDIMKNIISFYQKAKAFDKLSSFYDACAQVEIDEYRDYEKAGGALREAARYLSKFLGPSAEGDPRYDSLQQRLSLVEKFAEVRQLGKTDPDEMIRYCEELLDMPMIENAVRTGDVFAQITEHYCSTQQWQDAYRMIERMRERQIVLSPYLDRAMIEEIHKACGVPPPEEAAAQAQEGAHPEEDDMEEDIQVEED